MSFLSSLIFWIWGFIASVLCVIVTLLSAILVLIFATLAMSRNLDSIIRLWARILIKLARVEVRVIGLEHLPQTSCLFVFNHVSLFDIPLIYASIPRNLRFGAKKELFYIPVFGWGMSVVGMLKIDRKNRGRAIAELKKSIIKMQQQNLSIILAPEGTRQEDGKMGDFKTGPFLTAIQAQVPVVPLVLKGIKAVLPKNKFVLHFEKITVQRLDSKKDPQQGPHQNLRLDQRLGQQWCPMRVCTIEILSPVLTTGLTEQDRTALKEQVREKMSKSFQRS